MKIYYFNSALINNQGHFATYARSIISSLRKAKSEVVGLANINVDACVSEELGVSGFFKTHPNSYVSNDNLCGWLNNYLFQAEALTDDLNKITEISKDDIIIYDCAKASQIFGLVNWLQNNYTQESTPTLIIILGWPTGIYTTKRGDLGIPLEWNIADPSAILYRHSVSHITSSFLKKIRLVTPCQTAAAAYSALTGMRVELMPNPQIATTKCESRFGKGTPKIAFLGEQRENKGYRLVPDIANELLNRIDCCEIIVQNSWGNMDDVNNTLIEMSKNHQRLSVIIGNLNVDQWNALLNSIDLVVLPYDRISYSTCSSGIGTEAIANAIPQVVPNYTGMSDLLCSYGHPGVTFENAYPEDITRAIITALNNFNDIAIRASNASAQWFERNNSIKLSEFLTNPAIE